MYKRGNKTLIVFDLDGTLTPSKSAIKPEMEEVFSKLLEKRQIAVISGADFKQFKKQFLNYLNCPDFCLKNLFLFPTCSSSFYRYGNEWKKVYEESLSSEQKKKIFDAFEKTFKELNYKHPVKVYGEIIEDRISQVVFSRFGQQAPLAPKQAWDPTREKRQRLKKVLDKYLTEFEVNVSGTTSIDVTKKGIDKAYAIEQIEKHLKVPRKDMVFIGDALFEGGNDYPVKKTGVDCIEVKDHKECLELIKRINASS